MRSYADYGAPDIQDVRRKLSQPSRLSNKTSNAIRDIMTKGEAFINQETSKQKQDDLDYIP